MSLIKCPECGNMVSDKAVRCPKCGMPVSSMLNQNEADSQAAEQAEAEIKEKDENVQINNGLSENEISRKVQLMTKSKWKIPVLLLLFIAVVFPLGLLIHHGISNHKEEETITLQEELLNERDLLINSIFAKQDLIRVQYRSKPASVLGLLGALCSADKQDSVSKYFLNAYDYFVQNAGEQKEGCVRDIRNGYLKFTSKHNSYVEIAQFIEPNRRFRIFCMNQVDLRYNYQCTVLFAFFRYNVQTGILTNFTPPISGKDLNSNIFIASLPQYGKISLSNGLMIISSLSANLLHLGR